MSSDTIVSAWNDIKTLVEQIEADVTKNAHGNASAGVRARKGLRTLKAKAAELTKATIEAEKSRKSDS